MSIEIGIINILKYIARNRKLDSYINEPLDENTIKEEEKENNQDETEPEAASD